MEKYTNIIRDTNEGFCAHTQVVNHVVVTSFVFVGFIATGFMEMLNDIFELRVPVLSYVSSAFAVFWVPVVLFIIWFNAITNGHGKFRLQIHSSQIAGACMLFMMFFLESYHALIRGNVPNFELGFSWLWVLFLFFALSSFNHWKEYGLEVAMMVIAVCSSIICLFSIIFPVYSLADIGIANFFIIPNRPAWNGVNSNSYFAAIISVVSLYKILYCKVDKNRLYVWLGILMVNLAGVVFNKARGAWFGVLFLMILMSIVRLGIWKSKKVVLIGVVFCISIASILLFLPQANFESLLSFGRGLASAKTRIMMLSTALEIFVQSPLLGIGWAQVLEYRVAGHAIHGVIQTVAASYGVIGLALMSGIIYYSLPKRFNIQKMMLVLPVAFITVTAAVALMTPPFWFAIVLSLLYQKRILEDNR